MTTESAQTNDDGIYSLYYLMNFNDFPASLVSDLKINKDKFQTSHVNRHLHFHFRSNVPTPDFPIHNMESLPSLRIEQPASGSMYSAGGCTHANVAIRDEVGQSNSLASVG